MAPFEVPAEWQGDGKIDGVPKKTLRRLLLNDSTLNDLSLATKDIGDAGARVVAEALQHNSTLTTLVLAQNQIGDAGARAVAEALQHNRTLTALGLAHNQIGDAGAQTVAEALQHNSTLTWLILDNLPIEAEHELKINRDKEKAAAKRRRLAAAKAASSSKAKATGPGDVNASPSPTPASSGATSAPAAQPAASQPAAAVAISAPAAVLLASQPAAAAAAVISSAAAHTATAAAANTAGAAPASIPAVLHRLTEDNGGMQARPLPPLVGWRKWPQQTLKEALKPLRQYLADDKAEAKAAITYALDAADVLRAPENDPLTRDEAAAIYIYTMDTPFYATLNRKLNDPDRSVLQPFKPYLRLLLTALHKLPPVSCKVWRGIKADVCAAYAARRPPLVTWWAFSSCSLSDTVFKSQAVWDHSADRTMFGITCHTGRNITRYSAFATEDEVLLLPGTRLRIDLTNAHIGGGASIVLLTELQHESESDSSDEEEA